MTSEEKKIFDGVLFKPGDPELRQIKLRSHNLCAKYNRTTEDETEYRAQLLEQILGGMGTGVFMQGPIFFHYGTHTTIGSSLIGIHSKSNTPNPLHAYRLKNVRSGRQTAGFAKNRLRRFFHHLL